MDVTIIDAYCERTGPGLFAEPLNAVTNASFLVAALAAWHLARGSGRPSIGLWVLLGLAASIGIGSGLWHTFATPWTMLLDVVPILIFLVWFLWLYGRNVIGMSTPLVMASLVAFVLSASFAQRFGEVLNGSLAYAPALIALFGFGVFHARNWTTARFSLLAAAGVYALALVFRAVDQEVCSALPIGTHFLWHSLSGFAVYLAMRGLILGRAAPTVRLGTDSPLVPVTHSGPGPRGRRRLLTTRP